MSSPTLLLGTNILCACGMANVGNWLVCFAFLFNIACHQFLFGLASANSHFHAFSFLRYLHAAFSLAVK